MTIFECKNCRFRFQSEEPKKCPRCDSEEVFNYMSRSEQTDTNRSSSSTTSSTSHVIREGKDGWKDFHNNSKSSTCPECGGTEFDLNWKRKEKTCKKCGAILSLPRRFV